MTKRTERKERESLYMAQLEELALEAKARVDEIGAPGRPAVNKVSSAEVAREPLSEPPSPALPSKSGSSAEEHPVEQPRLKPVPPLPVSLPNDVVEKEAALPSPTPEYCPVDSPVNSTVSNPVDSPRNCPPRLVTALPTGISTELSTDQLAVLQTAQSPVPSTGQSRTLAAQQLVLTEKQAVIYYCLKWLKGQGTSAALISQATGINEYTIRYSIQKMRKAGYIKEYGGLVNVGGRIGFAATVWDCPIVLQGNRQKVLTILKNLDWPRLLLARAVNDSVLEGYQLDYQVGCQLDSLLNCQLDSQLPSSPTPPLSSSFSKETTTKGPEAIRELLHTDPELNYWVEKGLTEHQMQTWLQETGADLDVLVASLRHAAFELKDLGYEEKRSVKNVLSYFYVGTFKKNKFWAEPAGYKSHKQKEIEFKEAILRKKLEEENRLAELEKDEEFEAMWGDKEGDLYKQIETKLAPNERKRPHESPIRRAAMRKIFEDIKKERG